jgi:hypothetical protein
VPFDGRPLARSHVAEIGIRRAFILGLVDAELADDANAK